MSRKCSGTSQPAALTPIRGALKSESDILNQVRDGIGALIAKDQNLLDQGIRPEFSDSLALDEAMRPGRENENRWDYLLGHELSKAVVGVEPHSAKSGDISTVIAKRRAAIDQLRSHLKDGKFVQAWLWVASGKVHFVDTEKARLQLDQAGVMFVGTRVLPKHLDKVLPKKK